MKTPDFDYRDVLDYINEKAEKRYRQVACHRKFIDARIKEGFTLLDFQIVVDNMVSLWKDNEKMERYLRPSTLFSNKMDGYLNLNPVVKEKSKTEQFAEKANTWIKNSKERENGSGDIRTGRGGIENGGAEGDGRVYTRGLVQRPTIDTPRRLSDGDNGDSEN